MRLNAMAVEFPAVEGHPNRVPFEGVLTLVDVASDKAPSGARGHRVVLSRTAAEAALPSLLGMAVDFKAGWDGHDARQKCGIITAAGISGNELRVSGYLFARDFAEMMTEMEAHGNDALGMSYELADAHVANMRAATWTLTRATFTGAAILLRTKAAYRSTSFRVLRESGTVQACSTRVRARLEMQTQTHTTGTDRVAVRDAEAMRERAAARHRAPATRPMPVRHAGTER